MKPHPSYLSHIAVRAALKAGTLLRRGFGTSFRIDQKEGKNNLVTDYDRASEKCIIEEIRKEFPEDSFLGEEGGAVKGGEILWIIDPIDGTVNFAHAIPCFAISIAATCNGEVLAGVVYQPMTAELFVAEKGKGAYLNGERIFVSKETTLDTALLSTGFPAKSLKGDPAHSIALFADFVEQGISLRRFGSAAIDLSYLAAGRFDGFWEVTLQPWDIAAGQLLVEEAGGKVSQYDGTFRDLLSTGPLLASNAHLHAILTSAMTHVKPWRPT